MKQMNINNRAKLITRKSKDFLIEEAIVALLMHGGYDWAERAIKWLHYKVSRGKYCGTYLEYANSTGYQHVLGDKLVGGKSLGRTSEEELGIHIAYANHRNFNPTAYKHDIDRLHQIADMIDYGDISDLCEWSQSWIRNNTKELNERN